MRALIVGGQQPLEELEAVLEERGYELERSSAAAPELLSVAAGATLLFIDLRDGVLAAKLACDRLAELGDGGPFVSFYGDEQRVSEVHALLQEGPYAFVIPGDPLIRRRLSAFEVTARSRRRLAKVAHELELANAQISSMVDSLQEGIIEQARDGTVLRTNASARRILGLSEGDMRDRRWRGADWIFRLPDGARTDTDQMPAAVCIKTGAPARGFLVSMERPDGKIVWLSLNVEPVYSDDSRAPTSVVTSMTDVTERRQHEGSLRALLDKVTDGVLLHRGGVMLFMNQGWARMVGSPDRDAAVGRSIFDRVSSDNRRIIAPRVQQSERGVPPPPQELDFERPDGSRIKALVHTFPTIFDGEPALLTYARDLTGQRELEGKLIAANRMAALGRLAAGVGHEINNPLTFLIGNAEQALSLLTTGESRHAVESKLRNVLEGATRVQSIVRDLRLLSKPTPEERTSVDLAKVLESCLRIAERTVASRARVVREFTATHTASCNEPRVAQVLLNLLVNAAEAIPEGAPESHVLTVRTEDRPPHVVVTVGDTGAGIPKENLASIFEPFFTTKTDGRGTGLGLSISHTLIAAQGGRIEVESEVGKGTRMTVCLPMANEAEIAAAAPPKAPSAGPAAGTRDAGAGSLPRVLVVDDEVPLAKLIQSFLADYEVELAFSGEDALAKLEAGAKYDLVLCDLMMPGITGMELHERLAATDPGLARRFIFMTGGVFTQPAVAFLESVSAQGIACVEKPFRIDDLIVLIERKLAGEKSTK